MGGGLPQRLLRCTRLDTEGVVGAYAYQWIATFLLVLKFFCAGLELPFLYLLSTQSLLPYNYVKEGW